MNKIIIVIFAVLFLIPSQMSVAFEKEKDRKEKEAVIWKVGYHKLKNAEPDEWYSATVPGAVQLDYAKAKGWGDYNYAENWKDYGWMEDVFWTYKTSFAKPALENNEHYFFISKGIDYEFEILLNGSILLAQEGMFKPVELDLTNALEDNNELEVRIYPVPKLEGRPADRSQAAQSVKPAVSYGWDWHPRLVPGGIWDETKLEVRKESHFQDVYIHYTLNEDYSKLSLNLEVEGLHLNNNKYEWVLTDPDGKNILKKTGLISDLSTEVFNLDNPKLWWTHDHGKPNMYSSKLLLVNENGKILDEDNQKTGFRRIQLVMHEGAWENPKAFPKGRSNPPVTLELNGRQIFGKGSNWVNPEIFPGIITRERYNGLLNRALEANFNIFRVWGGGIVNKDDFYELCDEKGILVWTEFPLACNNYVGTPHYLSVLKQESEAIIKRVRKHPSNAIWSGGNELFNAWSMMTDQSLALRLLNSQCYLLDPEIPFIPTSPIMGMGHGNYVFKNSATGEEVFQWMKRANSTAYTEFGMPGASPAELLKKIIPEDELFPPRPGTSWESHHAFNAWVGDTWLMKDVLAEYFGESDNLEELVERSQWLQSEGYKCIFEEARRQKPTCSMALNWCYNEPWITAANNSLLNYPNLPKPAFYAVSNSCRPFLASARIPKFSYAEGEVFSCDIFILNDMYENIPTGTMNVKIKTNTDELFLLSWDFGKAGPNKNIEGPTVRKTLPHWDAGSFELILEVEGKKELSSSYKLHYRPNKQSRRINSTRALNQ